MEDIFKALDEFDMVDLYKDKRKRDEYYVLYVVKRPFEEDLNPPKNKNDREILEAVLDDTYFAYKKFSQLTDEEKRICLKLMERLGRKQRVQATKASKLNKILWGDCMLKVIVVNPPTEEQKEEIYKRIEEYYNGKEVQEQWNKR